MKLKFNFGIVWIVSCSSAHRQHQGQEGRVHHQHPQQQERREHRSSMYRNLLYFCAKNFRDKNFCVKIDLHE